MKNRQFRSALVALLLGSFAAIAGCGGPEEKPNAQTPLGNTSGDQQDAIKNALQKAGIKNPPAAIFDQDTSWEVVITPDGVGPNGEPPADRPVPDRVRIDKKSMEVTKLKTNDSKRTGRPASGTK